jgi:hypothetical protein
MAPCSSLITAAARSGAFPTRNQLATELHIPFSNAAGGGFLCQMWQKTSCFQADYGIFYAGKFVKESQPGRNLNYWALWAGYKF